MVVPQRISQDLVPQTVHDTIEDRLMSISDQIQSRSRLERIITDFDLYRQQRANGMIMEDVVQLMRSDIVVKLDGNGKESFRVTYESDEPVTAYKVTERLASLYIEENLKDKDNLNAEHGLFLESELEDAKRRLLEQEKKLEAYQKAVCGAATVATRLESAGDSQRAVAAADDGRLDQSRAREASPGPASAC